VTGEKLAGPATALIIASTEADADYFALAELDFVIVSETNLVSDSVYVGPTASALLTQRSTLNLAIGNGS
jgi:hypothetical protein